MKRGGDFCEDDEPIDDLVAAFHSGTPVVSIDMGDGDTLGCLETDAWCFRCNTNSCVLQEATFNGAWVDFVGVYCSECDSFGEVDEI